MLIPWFLGRLPRMKFSVLLPTRNRLDLLSYALETVRKQDYSNWEVIVSDNFSEEDVAGYVQSLNDPRIKYFRTDKFVPVTDNWNNALDKSDGDYVIMLGDDDCLMRGYFSTLRKVIEEHDAPDLIYTSAFLYAYPGVMPDFPDGFLRSYSYSKIFRSAHDPFWLEKTEAQALAHYSTDFKMRFDYNMQFSLVSRKLICTMKKYGAFYQSPYPDYYASNAMMLMAERILIVPKPLVTIGISPKSFGFYYFNDSESKGNDFLKNLPDSSMAERLSEVILPGTEMNTSWLFAMETIRSNFESETSIKVNYQRYRLLQILSIVSGNVLRKGKAKFNKHEFWKILKFHEKLVYVMTSAFMSMLITLFPEQYCVSLMSRMMGVYPLFSPPKIPGRYETILDVFERLNPTVTHE